MLYWTYHVVFVMFFIFGKMVCSFLPISLLSKHTGCSTLCILCPKWLLQIWSCMQIWSPNGCTGLQFISFTPIWQANCSLPSWFFCCHFGSTFVFARIYFNQRPIYQSSSVTSGSTRACWSSLAKRGFPSRYHYAKSDFYHRCRQFKPWWWPLISELSGLLSTIFLLLWHRLVNRTLNFRHSIKHTTDNTCSFDISSDRPLQCE